MAVPVIHLVTEGATERQVGKVLYGDHGLLSDRAQPMPRDWRSIYGKSREGYEQVIKALREEAGFQHMAQDGGCLLLMFDQEDSPSPSARAEMIKQDLSEGSHAGFWSAIEWQKINALENVFECWIGNLHIVLHVANAVAPMADAYHLTLNRDFDGYILQLLQGPHKETIAQNIVPNGQNPRGLLRKAEQEMTALMRNNGYPWYRNKSWLYAYITAFQFRQSHTWFAAEVVRHTPRQELERVFASLIVSWNVLIEGGAQ